MELMKQAFTSFYQWLSIPVMFWSFPVYLALQFVVIIKSNGYWRFLSAIPILPMLLILGYTIYALSQGSNLWPLLLLFSSPAALLYVFIFLIILTINKKLNTHEN